MRQKDCERPAPSLAQRRYDLTLITSLSVIMALGMPGCTPGDVPTEPESTPSAAAVSRALTLFDLGIPEFYSFAIALNNRGQVVGERGAVLDGPGRAFLWTRGKASDLGTLAGRSPVRPVSTTGVRSWVTRRPVEARPMPFCGNMTGCAILVRWAVTGARRSA